MNYLSQSIFEEGCFKQILLDKDNKIYLNFLHDIKNENTVEI